MKDKVDIDDNPNSQGVFRVSSIEIIFRKLLEEYLDQELDKAREEGKKELIKEIRESVKENIKIDDTKEKHIKIETDIVKILNDKEITKMFLDGEEGEDIDWDCCYSSWGWWS